MLLWQASLLTQHALAEARPLAMATDAHAQDLVAGMSAARAKANPSVSLPPKSTSRSSAFWSRAQLAGKTSDRPDTSSRRADGAPEMVRSRKRFISVF